MCYLYTTIVEALVYLIVPILLLNLYQNIGCTLRSREGMVKSRWKADKKSFSIARFYLTFYYGELYLRPLSRSTILRRFSPKIEKYGSTDTLLIPIET